MCFHATASEGHAKVIAGRREPRSVGFGRIDQSAAAAFPDIAVILVRQPIRSQAGHFLSSTSFLEALQRLRNVNGRESGPGDLAMLNK